MPCSWSAAGEQSNFITILADGCMGSWQDAEHSQGHVPAVRHNVTSAEGNQA